MCALLLLAGCSDSQQPGDDTNPYLPIAGLTIPRQGNAGEKVVLHGRGFTADNRIFLQRNGETEMTEAEVVHIDGTSLHFIVPDELHTGFYAVVLCRGEKMTRIGGINVLADSYEPGDFEIYVLAGEAMEVYPASVSKQVIAGTPLPDSRVKDLEYSGYVEATPDGMLYSLSYQMDIVDGWLKDVYRLSAYDMQTGRRMAPRQLETSRSLNNFFAIGQIDGRFHLLQDDSEHRIYTLTEWSEESQRVVQTFDFSAYGSAYIISRSHKCIYYPAERVLLLCGNMGTGEDMVQSSFALDLETGYVYRTGNDANYRYSYEVADGLLYCFATELDRSEDTDNYIIGTRVLLVDNVRDWTMGKSGATELAFISGVGFEAPVYSPVTGKIYGLDDVEEPGMLLTFDPQTGTFDGKKWINPGVGGIFYAPAPEDETEN